MRPPERRAEGAAAAGAAGFPLLPGVLMAAAALLVSACGLILLPDASGIAYFPEQENQVISENQVPWIRFPFAPDRDSVEAIFRVSGFSGRLEGRHHWDGEAVRFVPEPPFVPGRRYVLTFSGSFRDLQGIEYQADRIVPFFVGSDSETALYVIETDPISGGVASTRQEIRVEFSRPVDPRSTSGGLTLSPDTPRTLRWENDDRTLYLRPEEGWRHLSVYTISLSDALRDGAGAPLAREERVIFLVQEDPEAPQVRGVVPAFNDPAAGFPETGRSLEEGLDCRDALRVLFSEPMDREAAAEGFALVPGTVGRLMWLDDRTLVFAPEAEYQPGVAYAILLSSGVCDRSGNALEGYVPLTFTVRVPPIEITTTFLDDGSVIRPGEYTTLVPRTVLVGPLGKCDLLLELSGGSFDTPVEKQRLLEAISFLPVFPPSGVPGPELIGISWEGDIRVSLTYEGLRPSSPTQAVYYVLRIRGGTGGLATEEGSRLEGDLAQLLRWEEAP